MVNVAIVEFIVVTAILYKTYNKRQSAYGAMRTHGRWKFFTIISYNIRRVPLVRRAVVDLANFLFLITDAVYRFYTVLIRDVRWA